MTYIDTNIFIYAVTNSDAIGDACRAILRKVATRQLEAYTSYLTWDEFVYKIKQESGIETARDQGEKLLHFFNLTFLNADESILFKAQELMETYRLNPRDAIHAATALVHHIPSIISDDADFDKILQLKRVKPLIS